MTHIIGGADGPTAIYVTTFIPVWAIVLALGVAAALVVLAVYLVKKHNRKK